MFTLKTIYRHAEKFPHILTRDKVIALEEIYASSGSKVEHEQKWEDFFRAQKAAEENPEAAALWAVLLDELKAP